jgi:hypothetical protein
MSGSSNNSLDSASNDANQNMSPTPAGSPCQSCGSSPSEVNSNTSTENKAWIAIQLVDQENHPVSGAPYRIQLPDGSVIEDNLDERGSATIRGIDEGSCQVSFPDVD